jgi:cytochrome c-type protein NrfB
MRNIIVALAIVCGIGFISFSLSVQAEDQNMGAENIKIPAGSMPPVTFSHHLHQKELKDCNLCHDLFPQAPGSINDLKNQQKLQKKQVMNSKCIQCHKARNDAGKEAGPTECNKCHARI